MQGSTKYRPYPKDGEANVFTGLCLLTGEGNPLVRPLSGGTPPQIGTGFGWTGVGQTGAGQDHMVPPPCPPDRTASRAVRLLRSPSRTVLFPHRNLNE